MKLIQYLMICLMTLSLASFAATLHVPGEYGTIQAAINAAVDGDTVLIADGTYSGSGNRDILFFGKAIVVMSENGPANCIIDVEGTGNNSGFLFTHGEDNSSVLAGLTITNGYNWEGGAIKCHHSSPTITRCIIAENRAYWPGGGIGLRWDSSPVITQCTIYRNPAGCGYGISCFDNCNPTVVNCLFDEGSFYLIDSPNVSISYGVYETWSGNYWAYFLGNSVPEGLGEICAVNANGDSCDIFNNVFKRPGFVDDENGDFHLRYGSPCIDAGDPAMPHDPDGSIADIGALPYDPAFAPPGPFIDFSTRHLCFGASPIGVEIELDLAIYNEGNLDLIIYDIIPSLETFWTDFDTTDSLIVPDDSLIVMVYFMPLDSAWYAEEMTVYNNDDTMTVWLTGNAEGVTSVRTNPIVREPDFYMFAAFPNPFNPSTTLTFQLPVAGFVELEVFDINACRVGVGLAPTRWYPPGTHNILFDGTGLPSGVYLARLKAGNWSQVQKLVLLK